VRFLEVPAGGAVRDTQEYLSTAVQSHVAVKGGGVSAMPSMHLAAAMIYILASRRTAWLLLSVPFWTVIFLCSAYFGYHYWIDDLVGSAIACICWAITARFYDRATSADRHQPQGGAELLPA